VDSPGIGNVDLYIPLITHVVRGKSKLGSATITVAVPKGDGTNAEATLAVDVIDPALPTCAGTASTPMLKGGDTLKGTDKLAGASITLPKGADAPNTNSFIWSVPPFATDLSCGADQVPDGYMALGPAITFGPAST